MPGSLRIDPATFRQGFGRRPFLIGHELAGHPLFSLARLVELSQRLPPEAVEQAPGDVPISVDPERMKPGPLPVAETIRRIEECGAWLALKNVERDPEYGALLDRCLDEVREHSDPIDPGMTAREGFIFISSPGSITPYHMDPEHNFLLQVRGSKTVNMFDGSDRALLSAQELERFFSGGHRNLTFREEYQRKAFVTELQPGIGLHFPVTFPHYVKNGPSVSVSFSITFQTRSSARRAIVHKVDAALRRRGLAPERLGSAPWLDRLKVSAFEAARRLHRLAPPAIRESLTGRAASQAAPARY